MEQDGEDFYIVGADSVRKKLGNEVNYLGEISGTGRQGYQSFTIPSDVKKILIFDTFGYYQNEGYVIPTNLNLSTICSSSKSFANESFVSYVRIADCDGGETLTFRANGNNSGFTAFFFKLA